MKKYLKFSAITLLLLMTKISFAQITVSSYSNYAISISSENNKKLSVELKAFLNRTTEAIMIEPTVMYNFKQKEYHQISIGLGFNLNPFTEIDGANGITIPVQLEISPFEKMKNLSLLLEFSPQIGNFDNPFRTLWGIRYTFSKK